MPPNTLDKPKKIGDKNMIRVKLAVRNCLSGENPGVISFIRGGAKAIPRMLKTNKNKPMTLNTRLANSQAS